MERLMAKTDAQANIEVTSQQLLDELTEIKDRVGALENVAGIAHQDILAAYFKSVLSNDERRSIMNALRDPLTKKELQTRFDYRSRQALEYHLNPLREGLIHIKHEGGAEKFEWSLLFKRLPKKKREDLVGDSSSPNGKRKAKKDTA